MNRLNIPKIEEELERIKEKVQFEYNVNMDLIKLLEERIENVNE